MINITSISGNFFKTDSDSDFYYVVGTSGMVVIDKDLNEEVAYLASVSGYTDVWTEDNVPFVFLATSGQGIYRVVKDPSWDGDLSSFTVQHMAEPDLLSNVVHSIHGTDLDNILFGTELGIQYSSSGTLYQSTDYAPVTTVKLSSDLNVYYSGDFGITKRVGPVSSSWTSDDLLFILDKTTVPALTELPVNDFDVEITGDETTLAIATPSGVTVIREKSEQLIRSSSVLQIFKE